MDKSWWVSATVGGVLVIAGLLMMRSHWLAWQKQQADPDLEEGDLKYLRRRYRRRMQASGLFTVVGVMIPLGDVVHWFGNRPGLFIAYWGVVLVLVMWMVLLALGDIASTKVHTTVSLNRIRAEQRKLEREAAALRSQIASDRTSSNGAPSSDDVDTD